MCKLSQAHTATTAMAAPGTAPGQPGGPPSTTTGSSMRIVANPTAAISSVPNSASGGTATPDGKCGGGNSADPDCGIDAIPRGRDGDKNRGRTSRLGGAVRGVGMGGGRPTVVMVSSND